MEQGHFRTALKFNCSITGEQLKSDLSFENYCFHFLTFLTTKMVKVPSVLGTRTVLLSSFLMLRPLLSPLTYK